MMRIISRAFGVWILHLAILTAAHASIDLPLPKQALRDGQLRFGLMGDYLKTSANYNQDGAKANLNGNNYFQSIHGTGFFEYGATDDFTVFSRFQFVANSLSGTPATGTTLNLSKTGPGDAELGGRFRASTAPLRILLDLSVQLPLYGRLSPDGWSSLTSTSDLPQGEGVTSVTLASTTEIPLSTNFVAGIALGYTYRSSSFSSFLPYGGFLKYQEPRGFFTQFGLLGQAVISHDSFTGATAPNLPPERSNIVIAGSQALNAIDPSFMKLNAFLGTYLGNSVTLSAGVQYPITGKNIPQEPSFSAALGFDIGGTGSQAEYQHSNRGFQEYYLTSKVLVANSELKQVLINKGRTDGIRVGELLDVFEPDSKEGAFGDTVARGRVIEAGPTRSKIQLLEFFKDVGIQEGFVVRRPVR